MERTTRRFQHMFRVGVFHRVTGAEWRKEAGQAACPCVPDTYCQGASVFHDFERAIKVGTPCSNTEERTDAVDGVCVPDVPDVP